MAPNSIGNAFMQIIQELFRSCIGHVLGHVYSKIPLIGHVIGHVYSKIPLIRNHRLFFVISSPSICHGILIFFSSLRTLNQAKCNLMVILSKPGKSKIILCFQTILSYKKSFFSLKPSLTFWPYLITMSVPLKCELFIIIVRLNFITAGYRGRYCTKKVAR